MLSICHYQKTKSFFLSIYAKEKTKYLWKHLKFEYNLNAHTSFIFLG